MRSVILALALATASTACLPIDRKSDKPIRPGEPGYNDAVQVRSLGVGAFCCPAGRTSS